MIWTAFYNPKTDALERFDRCATAQWGDVEQVAMRLERDTENEEEPPVVVALWDESRVSVQQMRPAGPEGFGLEVSTVDHVTDLVRQHRRKVRQRQAEVKRGMY